MLIHRPSDAEMEEIPWEAVSRKSEAEHAARLLAAAAEHGTQGVHVLVHGAQTDTNFATARAIARQAGRTAHELCWTYHFRSMRENEARRTKSRAMERRLAYALLAHEPDAVLIVWNNPAQLDASARGDTDQNAAWKYPERANESTHWSETTATPTLWCVAADGGEEVSEKARRRCALAVPVRALAGRARTGSWQRALERAGFERAAATRIASAMRTHPHGHPSDFERALATAKATGVDAPADVHRAVVSLAESASSETERAPEEDFALEFTNADCDIAHITTQIMRAATLQISLCVDGPPGTGKSAYIRHLAREMGLPIVHKRASELLSKWVGESEKNIAEAFRETLDKRAFLVFDEADSLLASRRDAERSWEISQVNEMLTWMETHPYPFACTTNYAERLDEATARRFLFKTTLGYLTAPQAERLFTHLFGLAPPSALAQIANATPGDFALVRRKATVLGGLDDASALFSMLYDECQAKHRRTGAGARQASA